MKFIDILDDCLIDESIPSVKDKRYCTLMLSRKEYVMLRWALKTQDAINDVVDDEVNISHKNRINRK